MSNAVWSACAACLLLWRKLTPPACFVVCRCEPLHIPVRPTNEPKPKEAKEERVNERPSRDAERVVAGWAKRRRKDRKEDEQRTTEGRDDEQTNSHKQLISHTVVLFFNRIRWSKCRHMLVINTFNFMLFLFLWLWCQPQQHGTCGRDQPTSS